MNTGALCFSGVFRIAAMAGLLFAATSFTSVSNAAQGCGFGYHQSIYGGCILNHPGPGARPAPYHPGCWRNAWGQLRCYR
jgi:hypothetical protein